MADDDFGGGEGIPASLNEVAKGHVDQLFDIKNLSRLEQVMVNGFQTALVNALGAILASAGSIAAFGVETLAKAEDVAGPSFNRLAAAAIADLFDVNINIGSSGGGGGKVSQSAARSIGDALIKVFSGQASSGGGGGDLQPTDEPAKGFLTAMSKLALEGWLEGALVEMCSLGQLETFGELDDTISHVLGLGRASASVHGPLVNHLIVTPLDWKVRKDYRPELLTPSEVIKALLRGDYTEAEASEELARKGFSERRQAIMRKTAEPRLSISDALQLARHGLRGRDAAIQDLRDEGYDQATAELLVVAAETKRFDSVNDNSLTALVRAYVNREITDAEFSNFLTAIIPDDAERGGYEVTARTQREMNVRHLSSGEVIECIELGILPMAYYRDWLRREGYPDEEAFALELRLRTKIDKETGLEEQRARVQAERAEEKRVRDEAAAKRKADVEAERALHRRGSLADLDRAAVRGLISFSRVEEVLAAEYDPDTVGIMVSLLETDRQAYLDGQRRAEEAKQRAGRRSIDVGAIEQAVLNNIITLTEYRQRLGQLGFNDADADVLTATLEAKKSDLDDARAKRADAESKAKIRHIDLGRAEQLVRRGVHSLDEYGALLTDLGYDDGSRAAMIELLRLQVADDAAATELRRQAEARLNAKGVSLDTFRRAVILGAATEDQFQRFLVEQKFTSDAQALIIAELRNDVSEAADARRRREEAAANAGARSLSLDRVRSAVRLGLLSPAAYFDRLVREKYTADDIAIEKALLVQEIADVAAARAKRDAADRAGVARGLSLSDVERAVKVGAAQLEDYRARAIELGYTADDASTLVAVLQDELATAEAARNRRTTIDGELTSRTLSLGQLEAAVKAGALSIEAYQAQLESWGYGSDDAGLLAFLLLNAMNSATTGGSGG